MPIPIFPKKLKSVLPFALLPVALAAIYIVQAGRLDAFALIRYVSIAVFGYIAAVGDIKTKHIPNTLILVMLAVWVCITSAHLLVDIQSAIPVMVNSLLGFAISFVMFLTVYLISRKGLGGGDVKFMAAAGLYLGLGGAISAIFVGTTLAAIVGAALVIMKKIGRKDAFPLAPFLFMGILVTTLV